MHGRTPVMVMPERARRPRSRAPTTDVRHGTQLMWRETLARRGDYTGERFAARAPCRPRRGCV